MRNFILHIIVMALFMAGAQAAFAGGSNWCAPEVTPAVKVISDTDRITWVYNRSSKLLDGQHIDTINPYGDNVITDVGGLMQGGIRMTEKMLFGTMTNPNNGQTCMFYNTVEVAFHIYPTIFIASEYPPGTCMHNAIKAHEMKHIATDRDIVNRYAAGVGAAIRNEIQQRGIYGPFPTANLDTVRMQMKTQMESILKTYNSGMDNERRQRQQAIDNLQEYERVNHLCDPKVNRKY